jgi:hypothetical protein
MRNGFAVAAMLVTGALTMAAQTSTPVKDDLFAGTEIFAKGASDVTEVTMDPQTLGLVGGKDSAKAHRMLLSVVRTYEYDKPGMYKIEDVETFRNKLNTGEWHCSVHTRSLKTGQSTDICNKQRTDGLVESAIITVEPKSLTFIHTVRRKNDDGSEVGAMPLLMLQGAGGLSSMAMADPEGMADLALLKAQLAAGGAGSLAFGDSPGLGGGSSLPKNFMLAVPNDADLHELMDSAQKLKAGQNKMQFLLKVPKGADDVPPPAAAPVPAPAPPDAPGRPQ